MKKISINPDKGLLLLNSNGRWILCEIEKFDMVITDHNTFEEYAIVNSLFHMNYVPNELIEQLKSYIPTDEDWDNKTIDVESLPKEINLFD